MNSKEIEKIKMELMHNEKLREKWHDKGSNERLLYEEMNLRSMIMSCLCYGHNIYTDNYTLKFKDILGEDRFLKVCKEQEEYFKTKCRVKSNVYTDCEGVTYNSIIEE